MLFEKNKLKSGDVVVMKLVSGEEVLGKFVAEDDQTITVEKAMQIGMTPKGLGLGPLSMVIHPDSKLTFGRQHIVLITEPIKEIGDQYRFQTSGIQPVAAGSIVV